MMHEHYRRFARYNAWANERLYDACARLSADAYYQPRQAFFRSIHLTLNHLLVGDTIWTSRLRGTSPRIALNAELYDTLPALRAARAEMDAWIVDHVDGLEEADYAADVGYETTGGQPFAMQRGLVLAHFFNHQTHHRGQVHDMLSQTDVEPPPLDLLYFVRG